MSGYRLYLTKSPLMDPDLFSFVHSAAVNNCAYVGSAVITLVLEIQICSNAIDASGDSCSITSSLEFAHT